jgi:hypothetical protein
MPQETLSAHLFPHPKNFNEEKKSIRVAAAEEEKA